VDDGSSDGSLAVLQQAASNDSRFRICELSHRSADVAPHSNRFNLIPHADVAPHSNRFNLIPHADVAPHSSGPG